MNLSIDLTTAKSYLSQLDSSIGNRHCKECTCYADFIEQLKTFSNDALEEELLDAQPPQCLHNENCSTCVAGELYKQIAADLIANQ